MRLTPRTFAWLLQRSLLATLDDGCFGIAKGAAYSALLSFFPVLTSAATILVQTRAEFVSRTIEDALSEIVPPGSEDLVVQQFRVTGARPISLLIVAGLISVWAASGVIKSLIEGFQAAYRVPRNRGYIHQGVVAMALVLGAAVPLLCASLLVVFGGQAERAVLNWIKVDPILNPLTGAWQWLMRLTRYAVAFAGYGRGHRQSLLFRPLSQPALALRVARRYPGHCALAAGHFGIRLVRAQHGALQRDVRIGGRRYRAAGLDVPAGHHRPGRLRIQCRIRAHRGRWLTGRRPWGNRCARTPASALASAESWATIGQAIGRTANAVPRKRCTLASPYAHDHMTYHSEP